MPSAIQLRGAQQVRAFRVAWGNVVLISEYLSFVGMTDFSVKKPADRFEIALYGLAGEVGSLVTAVKKRLLAAGRRNWNVPNDEIVEELGDSIWYCFALGNAAGLGATFFASDVRGLMAEVGADDERGERIRAVLGERAQRFLDEAPGFLNAALPGGPLIDHYQRVAFLTSRSQADTLVEVCLAVLQQLLAELFRTRLPALEKELNQRLPDRDVEVVLGEVVWHLSALASLYELKLSDIAERNIVKLERRYGRGSPTPLKDTDRPVSEQLPRRFEITFVTIGRGRSRMYLDGSRLGDDLTDNAYADDGYRFHDVMHLALAAKLGWSPVLRKLIGKKRRSDPQTDEVEDGARAGIVEEAVIKAIHAEGVRLAALAIPGATEGIAELFAIGTEMSFGFLRRLEGLVAGLEVERNHYWEWEDAITGGFGIFNELRGQGQGTVAIDLEARSLSFSKPVYVNLTGRTAGIGVAEILASADSIQILAGELELVANTGVAPLIARKDAILSALGFDPSFRPEICVEGWRGDLVAVRAVGSVREAMWKRGVIAFRTAALDHNDRTIATAFAISDD
jgi:NTP pyrophosphatase (non-canonical NTP hydrolase)